MCVCLCVVVCAYSERLQLRCVSGWGKLNFTSKVKASLEVIRFHEFLKLPKRQRYGISNTV